MHLSSQLSLEEEKRDPNVRNFWGESIKDMVDRSWNTKGSLGFDLMMSGTKEDVDGILAGLKDGTITRAELEACAGRILALSKELS